MKTIFFLQRTHINTPQYQNSANPNLGNRFSAKPLKDTPIRQNFPQSGIAKPSTYERNIQIAKVAATVIGLATMIFAAYRYISKPISCEDLEDNFSGTVKCRFQDGSMYQGELKNDLLSGQGSYTNLFGRIFSGTFKDDEFIHDGRSIALDELDQCKPEGLTDCVISLRNKGCGSIDPAYSGTVDCSFKDGARYQGSVVKEIFSGNGSYTNPSGHTFSGTFKDDRFIDESRSITLAELDRCV